MMNTIRFYFSATSTLLIFSLTACGPNVMPIVGDGEGRGDARSEGRSDAQSDASDGESSSAIDTPSAVVRDVPRIERRDSSAQPGQPVVLGTAANYVILAKSGISTVPPSAIVGDLGVSPASGTYITGFSLTADRSNTFSTSTQVTGRVYAATYTEPTPTQLTLAVGDMQRAFTDAAGRAADVTELGAGDIGGLTLPAGVYRWSSGLLVSTTVTLTGTAADVWIFQVAENLTLPSTVSVTLAGGALAKNVFWQVSGAVTLGTTAHMEGVVLSQTAIIARTGATIRGRLLAQTAVSLDSATVTQPAP